MVNKFSLLDPQKEKNVSQRTVLNLGQMFDTFCDQFLKIGQKLFLKIENLCQI